MPSRWELCIEAIVDDDLRSFILRFQDPRSRPECRSTGGRPSGHGHEIEVRMSCQSMLEMLSDESR